jgi:hypothetical protein
LKCDEKALIDLVDGLSSGSIVLVSVADGDLADHHARLKDEAVKRLLGHDDHAQAIAATLLITVKVLFGGGALSGDQILSRRTINECGLQQVCNHKV